MAYEVCDAFIEDAVRYSDMDTMYLTTLRSQVMAAKDLAFFERLFSTTSDKLLRAYSAHSIEQAREMAFRDTRQWELLLLDIGIKDPLVSCGAPIIWPAERHCEIELLPSSHLGFARGGNTIRSL